MATIEATINSRRTPELLRECRFSVPMLQAMALPENRYSADW
jgi:hypothetical protein